MPLLGRLFQIDLYLVVHFQELLFQPLLRGLTAAVVGGPPTSRFGTNIVQSVTKLVTLLDKICLALGFP